ncbi:hypothetical protein JXA84_09700 [candidate division WOR-3 bacterium]|nr:hypothetical protein [candidate division WOR-3 bacterium]
MKKVFFVFLGFYIFYSTGCIQKTFTPYGENVQEGVMLYFEVTQKTPDEVSDQYYGVLREVLINRMGWPLPQRIQKPWAFCFLGFNPVNGEIKFMFISDTAFPSRIESLKDTVEKMVIFRDDLNRETGGYTLVDSRAYVYSGSSSYTILKGIIENDRPFHRSDNFQKLSEMFSENDWVRVFIPGSVFSLLDMVPSELKPLFLEDVKAEKVQGFSARVMGEKSLVLEAFAIVDSGEISAKVSFSGWDPKKVHASISRRFFWNL